MRDLKRLMALLCATVVLAFAGCSEENGKSGIDKETANTDNSSSSSSTAGDVTDEVTPLSMSMTIDGDGNIDIERDKSKNTPMGEEGTWTVFVYISGADLESENGLATADINEMKQASTAENVKFVIQTGGAEDWYNSNIDASKIQRFEICGGRMELVESLPDANMGDSETLRSFLDWGIDNYAAAKMGLVFWNHGGGSLMGVCFDFKHDRDSLDLTEINTALSSVYEKMTDHFEFIGFDACVMSTIESANILATYSRYMIASQEIEPGYGWDYYEIGKYLNDNPTANGLEVGKAVCNSFYSMCEGIYQQDSATMAVIELSQVDEIITSFNSFVKELYDACDDSAVLSSVIRNMFYCDNFGGNNDAEGYTNMVDLAGVVNSGAEYSENAQNVVDAINNAVKYVKNGSNHKDACGLSIYYPIQIQGSRELELFGNVTISPFYLSFVERIVYGMNNNGNASDYENSGALDMWGSVWGGGNGDYSEFWSGYNLDTSGESSLIQFSSAPKILDDGTYGFVLTPEALSYTSSVQATVFMLSDDEKDLISFGETADVIGNWSTGAFTDNFDGYWFCLPDGQNLAVYTVSECAGYDIYTSPIYLNGQRTNLRLTHDYINGKVIIDGVWGGIDENGMAAKDVVKLEKGDRIIPLYDAYIMDSETYETDYYYGEEYVYDGFSQASFDRIYDGEYYYGFVIYDIFYDYYISPAVNFTVDGDDIYYYTDGNSDNHVIQFYDEPQLLDDGSFCFSLTYACIDEVDCVKAYISTQSKETNYHIMLGSTTDIIADWDKGVFYDNFQGKWFMLGNYQLLSAYYYDTAGDYCYYNCPVSLNGYDTYLTLIQNTKTGTVTIDGVKAGDVIAPMYYAYEVNGSGYDLIYGNEYTCPADTKAYYGAMADGEYYYSFDISDIYGGYIETSEVNFTIENDTIYYNKDTTVTYNYYN